MEASRGFNINQQDWQKFASDKKKTGSAALAGSPNGGRIKKYW